MERHALISRGDVEIQEADGRYSGRPRPRALAAGLMLPREHGAWAMFLMPYLVGTAAAGWGGWTSLLLLISILLIFISSRPLEIAMETRRMASGGGEAVLAREAHGRRIQAVARLAAYLGLGALAGALLLLGYGRWALLPMGGVVVVALAAQLVLRRHRLDRIWPARLLTIAALSATGPAAYYVASGALDRHAAAVWLLGFLYSGASVFYVRLHYQALARQRSAARADAQARAGRQLTAYVVFAVSAAVALAALGWLPPLAVLTLAPLVAKVVWSLARRDYRPTLKQIGFAEIGHTTLFAILASIVVATW